MELLKFKDTEIIDGDRCTHYNLIGADCSFIYDEFEETVQVLDDKVERDESSMVYSDKEFLKTYGGEGLKNSSIESLIKFEYAFLLDMNSDVFCSEEQMNSCDKKISYKDIAHTNFN